MLATIGSIHSLNSLTHEEWACMGCRESVAWLGCVKVAAEQGAHT
jgi:hypothetical protein